MTKISKTGYKRTSKDKNEPALVIPSNNITMKGVDFPVLGTDNTGYSQMMYPGMEYVFPGSMVYETPMMQDGGQPLILLDDDYGKMRQEAYADSLTVYNQGQKANIWLKSQKPLSWSPTSSPVYNAENWDKYLNSIPESYLTASNNLTKLNNKWPTPKETYFKIGYEHIPHQPIYTFLPSFKKPVQPISLEPRFSKIEMNGIEPSSLNSLDYAIKPSYVNVGQLPPNEVTMDLGHDLIGKFNIKERTWKLFDRLGHLLEKSDGTKKPIRQTTSFTFKEGGWLNKYQDGGIKSFGSKYEYVTEAGKIKLRRKGDDDWKVLDDQRSAVFQNIIKQLSGTGKKEDLSFVEGMFSNIMGPEYKKPVKEKKPEPNLVSKPVIAEVLPTFASAVSGVEYPEVKEQKTNKEAVKYTADPEFQMMPYKDEQTAITEYQKTPTYSLRYKNMSDYSPDDIIQVQSYLDKNGYFPERKKQINIDDYKTPEQIIELQKYLVKEGLIDVLGINNDSPNGELSGKLDKNTRTAIEQYNMYNKKFKEGELDESTKDAIRQFQNKTDAKTRIGVTVADPFELYDPKTGEPNVELTNKAMQKFEEDLMKRGFFTGNVKYDISSKAIENPRVAFKFTLNDDPTTAFGHCAQYVNGTVCKDDVVGEEAREELGFKGSAWQISENLQNKGGSLVFAGLPERSQIKLGDANEINNYLKSTLTSAESKNNLQEIIGSGNIWKGSSVKPGDVVNIFFEGSSYTKEAYNQTAPLNNRFFTTHVGIVKADDQGNLYVEHNVHGKVEKDKLQDFADGKVKGNGKNKVSLIAGITRPNYFDGVDNDGRIPAAGISYYQTEYGQFKPEGALANQADWAGQAISGENTYKFLSVIEKNKDSILKDIPITENEFGKLMRVARVIPTLETYAGKNYEEPNVIVKGLQDAFMPDREKSMGITSLKDETNINAQLRSKLYESDYDLADPVKAGLPTFYVLSKNYLYLKEIANEYQLNLTVDQLAKLAGLSYNQSIGKVAAELIQKGGYDNYIKYRRDTAKEGDGKFKYHGVVDLYDKQTMKYGGWLQKYQGNEGPSQVKPTSNFTLPSLDPQAQQSADYNKGWEEYNKGVELWRGLLEERERKKGRALTTDEKQKWLQKAVRKTDGRKTEVDPNDPKWDFMFKDSYLTWDPEFGPVRTLNTPVDVTYQLTDLDKEKQKIAAETRKAEMTPFAKSLGMKETDPNVQKRASQNANDQVALRILNDKPQGDRNRVEWLNSLTPEERSTIARSQYAGKLEQDFTSQFSQGLEKNLRNVANIATVGPINWYQGNNVINQPLWTNPDYTQEEAANASAMGILAPLSYPTNLVTGAITGDFGSALQGQRSKPLFTDYRQPEFASTMGNLYEGLYDPLNAVGIGIMEKVPVGKMTSELAGTLPIPFLKGKAPQVNKYFTKDALSENFKTSNFNRIFKKPNQKSNIPIQESVNQGSINLNSTDPDFISYSGIDTDNVNKVLKSLNAKTIDAPTFKSLKDSSLNPPKRIHIEEGASKADQKKAFEQATEFAKKWAYDEKKLQDIEDDIIRLENLMGEATSRGDDNEAFRLYKKVIERSNQRPDAFDQRFKDKVSDIFRMAGIEEPENFIFNKNKDYLINVNKDDLDFNNLSFRDQQYLLDNYRNIGGVRTKDATITLGGIPYQQILAKIENKKPFQLADPKTWFGKAKNEPTLLNIMRYKLEDPDIIRGIAAHETGHDLQSYKNWISKVQKYDSDYKYYTGSEDNPLAKRIKDAFVNPVKPKGTRYDYQTWLSGYGEFHSELMKARENLANEYLKRGMVSSMDEAIAYLKAISDNDDVVDYFLKNQNLEKHFKPGTSQEEKRFLTKIAPAAIPTLLGTGAAAVIAGQDTPQQKYGGWLQKYQEGGEMPFGLPLRSANPGSPWAYESPQANGYLLPDPNRPELLNTGATEYKMEADGVTIPTVVNGQYMEPDQAYQRYMLTGEKFKPMIDPHSYSAFYNTVGPLGLMKQKKGGPVRKNQYINNVTLSNTSSWLDKYK